MFSLEPFLESRYVVLKIRGPVAVHFISTLATSERTWHALWLESIPTLPDFLLKVLFADHISSVSFCHLSSLPQLSVPESLAFVNEVFGDQSGHGFSPHIGGGGSAGTDHGQQLSITASGNWSVTSDDWLDVQPSSGSGNANVTANLRNLAKSSLPTDRAGRVAPGVYSGSVVVSDGTNTGDCTVTLTVGYGDTLYGKVYA